jgi:hypothetical protein
MLIPENGDATQYLALHAYRKLTVEARYRVASPFSLRTLSESVLRHGCTVRVLIRAGSEIDPGIMDELDEITGVTIHAESPYLVRWLKEKLKPANH